MKGKITEIVISAVAIVIALAHMFVSEQLLRIDSTTLVLLALAAVPWLFPFLKSLTLPGGAVVEFRDRLLEVEKKDDVIEDHGLLPGRPEPVQVAAPRSLSRDAVTAVTEDQWNIHPNSGKFGGKSQAN